MSNYNVNVDIRADSSSLKRVNKELDELKRDSKQVANNTGNIGGGANIASLKKVALGMAAIGTAALAAAAAAKKVADVVSNEFRDIQNINDFALYTGASAKELANLEARAVSAGVEFNRLREILTRQQEKLQEGNIIFEQLGLDINRLSVLDPAQAFQEIINAIEGADDAALRARGITQLLGESGVEALKLAGNVGTVREQLEAAQRLGLVIDVETLANANEFDSIMNSLNSSVTGLRRSLTRAFGPALINSVEAMTALLEKINPTTAVDITKAEIASLNAELEEFISKQKQELISPENGAALRSYTRELRNLNDALLEQQEALERSNERLGNRRLTSGERSSEEEWNARILERIEGIQNNIESVEEERLKIQESITEQKAEELRISKENEASSERRNETVKALNTLLSSTPDKFDVSAIIDAEAQLLATTGNTMNRVILDAELMGDSVEDLNNFLRDAVFNIIETKAEFDAAFNQNRTRSEAFRIVNDNDIETTEELIGLLAESNISIKNLELGAKNLGIAWESLADKSPVEALLQILNVSKQITNSPENAAKFFDDILDDYQTQLELSKENLRVQSHIAEIESGRIRSQEELDRYIEDELRTRKLLNGEISVGAEYLEEQLDISRKQRDEALRLREEIDEFVDNTIEGVGSILGDSIVDGLETGRFAFRDFLADIGELLIRSGIQELVASIFSPQAGGRSLAFNFISSIAGSILGGGGSMYGEAPAGTSGTAPWRAAKGAVVNRPTSVMGGQGLIGEAGPEGILPLKRLPSGNLGVESSGGGSNVVNINTTVNVSGGQDDSNTIADRTSRAIERTIEAKVYQVLAKESRSGNALNRPIRNF